MSSQVLRIPSSVHEATISSRSAAGPASTVLRPLYAATDTCGKSSAKSSTSSASVKTATIDRPRADWPNSRPRSATNRAPSSRLNTPATQAAAYCPTLCPSTTSGSMPHDCHSRARPISMANSAGWAKAVCRKVSPSFRCQKELPAADAADCRRRRPHIASRCRAKTGSVSNSLPAIPWYWLPWPGEQPRRLRRVTADPAHRPGPADLAYARQQVDLRSRPSPRQTRPDARNASGQLRPL